MTLPDSMFRAELRSKIREAAREADHASKALLEAIAAEERGPVRENINFIRRARARLEAIEYWFDQQAAPYEAA